VAQPSNARLYRAADLRQSIDGVNQKQKINHQCHQSK
jgi:hypothetical protein